MALRACSYKDSEKLKKTRRRQNKRYYAKTKNLENNGKRWTKDEDIMVWNHEIFDTKLSEILGRSVLSIQTRRKILKKRIVNGEITYLNEHKDNEVDFFEGVNLWTKKEDDFVIKNYPDVELICKELNRTKDSVNTRIIVLRSQGKLLESRRRFWNSEEDEIVMQNKPIKELAKELGRNERSVMQRRYVLKKKSKT